MQRVQVTPQVLSLIWRQLLIPSPAGSIIVRPGIYDRVRDVVVREVGVIRIAVEGKLEDTGTRHLKLIAERTNVRCDQTQILSNER